MLNPSCKPGIFPFVWHRENVIIKYVNPVTVSVVRTRPGGSGPLRSPLANLLQHSNKIVYSTTFQQMLVAEHCARLTTQRGDPVKFIGFFDAAAKLCRNVPNGLLNLTNHSVATVLLFRLHRRLIHNGLKL